MSARPAELEPISFRPGRTVSAWLSDRMARMMSASLGVQARTELEVLAATLAAELRRIPLTVAQASCLADVVAGSMMSAGVGHALRFEVEDAFALAPPPSDYGSKWEVDEGVLLDLVRNLGPCADQALYDALSRWWQADGQPTAEGFSAVGITILEARWPSPAISPSC